MRKKVGVCGVFGKGNVFAGGQPVKVGMIIDEIRKTYGENEVYTVNTYQWKKKPIKLVFNCFRLAVTCDNIIILPAHNGVKVFVNLFLLLKKAFKNKIHYIVIGGWLPDLLQQSEFLYKSVEKLDSCFVETNLMKNRLKSMGLTNVEIMNNFKNLKKAEQKKYSSKNNNDYKFCFFSRVMFEKGIEDIIRAISVLREDGYLCSLDIYGEIKDSYRLQFDQLSKSFPQYIRYIGTVSPEQSVDTLRDYFMQVFPTHFYTEGIPGSIIDSYFAGLPVLASKWESFQDVIEDNHTGIGYDFDSFDDLVLKLKWAISNSDIINEMRSQCLKKSDQYTAAYSMPILINKLR